MFQGMKTKKKQSHSANIRQSRILSNVHDHRSLLPFKQYQCIMRENSQLFFFNNYAGFNVKSRQSTKWNIADSVMNTLAKDYVNYQQINEIACPKKKCEIKG